MLPPYNGFGSLEDSKQSCLSLIPQPPKKDYIKMLENDGKILRYAAVLVRKSVGCFFVVSADLIWYTITLEAIQSYKS